MSPSSALIDREYLTRAQLAEFLTARGYPISRSTLAKLCARARRRSAGGWILVEPSPLRSHSRVVMGQESFP